MFKEMTMMKQFALLVVLELIVFSAMAQRPGSEPSGQALQYCLLMTDDGTWTRLELDPDQMERVHRVQEACRKECEATGRRKEYDPVSNADGSTVMSELRGILTEDQYRTWLEFCRQNGERRGR